MTLRFLGAALDDPAPQACGGRIFNYTPPAISQGAAHSGKVGDISTER